MQKNWIIGGVIALVLVVVAGGAYMALGDDGDGDATTLVAEDDNGDAAKCLPEAPDCEPTDGDDVQDDTSDGTALGVCAPGVTDCVDTVVGGDDTSQICIAGAEDCNDTPGSVGGGADPARAQEIVFADLESRVDSTAGEITVVSLEAAEWPNSCLGVEKADQVCAEVITPGFKIVLEQLGTQYEYHTDSDGTNFAIVE